jgi:group I intron endonuclease
MPFVYRLTNKINGTVYIGKANDVEKRLRGHRYYAQAGKERCGSSFLVVDAAIAKYGFDNFLVETIHETETEDQAYQLEELEISTNKINGIRSYNIGDGGKTNSGWHHTEETKKKISESHSSEERRASLLKNPAILVTAQSKEVRAKIVQSNTGKKKEISQCEIKTLSIKEGRRTHLLNLMQVKFIKSNL